jgi:hypothetical protein
MPRLHVPLSQALLDTVHFHRIAEGNDLWTLYDPGDVLPSLGSQAQGNFLSVQDFRDRFTDAEIDAIIAHTNAGVRRWLSKLYTRREPLDMTPGGLVQNALDLLVTLNLLTPARRAVIGV